MPSRFFGCPLAANLWIAASYRWSLRDAPFQDGDQFVLQETSPSSTRWMPIAPLRHRFDVDSPGHGTGEPSALVQRGVHVESSGERLKRRLKHALWVRWWRLATKATRPLQSPPPRTSAQVSTLTPAPLRQVRFPAARLRERLEEALGMRRADCLSIIERLGGGGGGEVWKCRVAQECTDSVTEGHEVAVKVFGIPENAKRESAVSQALRALSNQDEQGLFTLPLKPFGDRGILVLPLASSDAKAWLLEGGAHTLFEKVKVFDQVLLGLAKMHELGLVHADVKLENILVFADGKVSLADFGLACKYLRANDLQDIVVCSSESYTITYRAVELLTLEEKFKKRDADRTFIRKAVEDLYNRSVVSAIASTLELRSNKPGVALQLTQAINGVVADTEDEWLRVQATLDEDVAADRKAKARQYRTLIGPKTDAFAAGIMLYVMLFYTHPIGYISRAHEYQPTPSTMQFRIEEDMMFLKHLHNDDIKDMLRGLLHPDPSERWTVQQAHTGVQKFLERQGVAGSVLHDHGDS